MAHDKLILDHIYDHVASQSGKVFLTQPLGGGQVADYTWGQVMDQAQRMAAHLQAQGCGPGSHVAILSKNCAHFFIAELAIWMAGGGIRGGISHGATDEFGYNAVEDVVDVHDFHATLLHLLGMEHKKLTFRFQGRDFRLTDVAGRVVAPILA